jgi:hypothetical protein
MLAGIFCEVPRFVIFLIFLQISLPLVEVFSVVSCSVAPSLLAKAALIKTLFLTWLGIFSVSFPLPLFCHQESLPLASRSIPPHPYNFLVSSTFMVSSMHDLQMMSSKLNTLVVFSPTFSVYPYHCNVLLSTYTTLLFISIFCYIEYKANKNH